MIDAGIPSAIAAPGTEARWGGRVPLVPCATWPVPRGPLIRIPRGLPLPDPVVVHVHGLGALPPWSPFPPGQPARPVVATLHGVLDARAILGMGLLKRAWHRSIDARLLRRLSAIHVTRPSEIDTARSAVGAAPAATCIPWMLADDSPERAAPAAPSPASAALPPRAPYFLCVGRLNPIKGVERLLDALARMPPGARPRLLLAGAGPRRYSASLSARAKDLGLRDRVEFLGLVTGEPLRALYAEAAALVLPSRYENFGMVVPEALREGCPVIAARETPWQDLEPSGAGRWVDFDRPDDVATVLSDTLDSGRRAEMGRRSREFYGQAFTPATLMPRFVAWYAGIVRLTEGSLTP